MLENFMDKILDPNNLIHVANVILLFAFAVRKVFLLRILFIIGSFPALGFYYYLSPPLWSAIGWTCVYIAIHAYWIVRIYLERRPVILAPEEEKLYELAFSRFDRRKFLTLVSLGRWQDGKTDQILAQKGEKVAEVCVLISGKVKGMMGEKQIAEIPPGQIVGSAALILGAIPCDLIISEPCRYIAWDVAIVEALRTRDPELDSQLSDIVNIDLAKKIKQLVLKTE